tara:strand:- start:520 stop:693 length:174 start_codon:yes stop_codon:yes gene_type:complete
LIDAIMASLRAVLAVLSLSASELIEVVGPVPSSSFLPELASLGLSVVFQIQPNTVLK